VISGPTFVQLSGHVVSSPEAMPDLFHFVGVRAVAAQTAGDADETETSDRAAQFPV
jgi:hypothetical protein